MVVIWVPLVALSSKGAVQVEGTATYEAFSVSSGSRGVFVEEQFSATVEGGRWFVATSLKSTQPPMQRPELFCPPAQTAGSDGEDSSYWKEMRTNRAPVAWVEPGSVPNMAQSPTICLIWLAYCSGHYFETSGKQQLKPIWVVQQNQNRQGKCMMPVTFERSKENPDFLSQLDFLADGRLDSCNPSHGRENMRAEPWQAGFTQAVYRVERMATLPEGKRIPAVFIFELFSPGPPGPAPPKLGLFARIKGTVTNTLTVAKMASWLPQLPNGQRVMVQDYRFTGQVTNWDNFAYAVTNQWAGRSNVAVVQAVRLHATTAPPR